MNNYCPFCNQSSQEHSRKQQAQMSAGSATSTGDLDAVWGVTRVSPPVERKHLPHSPDVQREHILHTANTGKGVFQIQKATKI